MMKTTGFMTLMENLLVGFLMHNLIIIPVRIFLTVYMIILENVMMNLLVDLLWLDLILIFQGLAWVLILA